MLDYHDIELLIKFQVYFDSTERLFYKNKIKSHGVYVVKLKTLSEGFF